MSRARADEWYALYLEIKHIRGHVRRVGHVAICEMMSTHLRGYTAYSLWIDYRAALFSAWPQFSGSLDYPVPADHEGRDCQFFQESAKAGELWLDAYGERREDLFAFLQDECLRRADGAAALSA